MSANFFSAFSKQTMVTLDFGEKVRGLYHAFDSSRIHSLLVSNEKNSNQFIVRMLHWDQSAIRHNITLKTHTFHFKNKHFSLSLALHMRFIDNEKNRKSQASPFSKSGVSPPSPSEPDKRCQNRKHILEYFSCMVSNWEMEQILGYC